MKNAPCFERQWCFNRCYGFSSQLGCIDFLGINPQYRKQGIQKLFLDALMDIYLPGQEISMTTYREDDKADTGHRDILKQLGFAERELLIEFGYPTQRFVLPPKYRGYTRMMESQSNWRKRTILFFASQCITLFGSQIVQMAIVWYVTC